MTINADLDKRLARVVRNHERMRRNGVVHKVGKDGLIRSRGRLVRPRFPIKGAILAVALLMAFKALLFATLGSGAYEERVETLRSGSMVEQAGAMIMQSEPVTTTLGGYLTQYVFQR